MKFRVLYFTVLLFALTLSSNYSFAQQKSGSKPTAITSVTFYYFQSLIFVKAKINNTRTNFLFLLNTGANTTVINNSTANIIKLPVIRETDTAIGTAGKVPITICKVGTLSVGNAVVTNMEVSKRDLTNIVSYNGQKIDGIIGTDFLKNFAYTIDFVSKKISFFTQSIPVGKQKSIPFSVVDGIPRIICKLNDTLETYLNYNSGVGMVESNNNYLNISYNQWRDLKKLSPNLNHSSYFTGRGVGGDVYMQVVKITNVQMNQMAVRNPYIIIQNKEGYFKSDDAIGFFGNNVLEKYRRVGVDFLGNNIIIVNNSSNSSAKVKRGHKR